MRRAARRWGAALAAPVLFALPLAARGQVPPSHDGEDEAPDEAPVASAPSASPSTAPSGRVPPQASARPHEVLELPQRDGMVRVPGGSFRMGSLDPRTPPNERPAVAVTVAPFWMDRTEVTVGAYKACVQRRRCEALPSSSMGCTATFGDDELPVSCVPFRAAEALCRATGKRLPTEAEWEFAARGTTVTPFPWGGSSTSCHYAVTLAREWTSRSCAGDRPARVGSRAAGASVFGILDLAGNVEEWTTDWYAEQRTGVAPRTGASHVLRGGGWLSPPSAARVTSRNWGSALEAGPNVGFRCARGD